MKKSGITLSFLAIILLFGFAFNVEAQESRTQNNVIDITKEDFENFSPERQAHIKANPERFNIVDKPTPEMLQQAERTRQVQRRTDDGKIILTKEQFDSYPAERQLHIKENPDRFKVIEREQHSPE